MTNGRSSYCENGQPWKWKTGSDSISNEEKKEEKKRKTEIYNIIQKMTIMNWKAVKNESEESNDNGLKEEGRKKKKKAND